MSESITTTSNLYYVYPDCPFRSTCSDNGVKCETCANNPKRSYYRPVEPSSPYIPIEPYYPYYPYYPTYQPYYPPYYTTCQTSTNESHYQST